MERPWHQYPSPSNKGSASQGINVISGYPILFHWLGFVVVLVLLIVSVIFRITPLTIFSIFFLVLGTVAWLWSRMSLKSISLETTLNQDRAFPGESVELTLRLINRKWLPQPWLEIEEEVPYRLAKGISKSASSYMKERLRWVTSIAGGQGINWKQNIVCKGRGEHRLGPVRLRSGDIFGIFPREMAVPSFNPVLVYPKVVPVEKMNLPMNELSGERIISWSVQEDVSLTMGAREYRPGDSFKHIHWAASARTGELKTRQYESSTSLSIFLVLDAFSFNQSENGEETFELAVTTAASLAYKAYQDKSAMGLMANSLPEINIQAHSGRGQLLLILEALARVQEKARLPLYEYINRNRESLSSGTTPVIITKGLSLSTMTLGRQLGQEGYSCVILSIGEKVPAPNIKDLPVIWIQSEADLARVEVS